MTPYAKMVLYFSIIAVLMLCSAFFSCADMVYSSVSLSRLERTPGKRAKKAYDLAKNYENTIVAILFGNNLVNIVASSLGAAISLLDLAPFNKNPSVAALVIELSMLGLILCFGEILPKTIGKRFNYRLSLAFCDIVKGLGYLFYPFVKISHWFARLVSRPVLNQIEEDDETKTDEELQAMVDVIEEEGLIDEDQSELLSRSIEFKDTQAFMVMTPRVNIEALEFGDDPITALEKGKLNHSRIPVFRKNLDNIEGYIPLKNLQREVLSGKKPEISDLLLPILSVPRSMPISAVLDLFKQEKRHIALVKDEFGGNEGILTMEDILEELVGEMYDESETKIEDIEKTDKRNVYHVRGITEFDALLEYFGLPLPEEEVSYSTVSGFLVERLGRFAEVGDKVKYGKLDFTVEKAGPYVVESALVVYHPRRKA
ncbi:MAG: HlyC/CorC family transporter [Bacilli bacterium]|nr:HlyC/CorC family transporter [Bacilli bacterium]